MTRRGFTLIEALVSLVIASTFLWGVAGWLWPRPGTPDAAKILYANALLEEHLSEIIETRTMPVELLWQEKRVDYPVWSVFYITHNSGLETCITATAVFNHVDTISSMAGCFYEP